MKKKLLTVTLTSILLLTACQSAKLATYTSDSYTFEYPFSFTIEEATESFPALTVRGDSGRVEIFKMSDFGDRPFGFSGEETQEELDIYVPKEQFETEGYSVWLFYDENSSGEVKAIADSLQVKTQTG